MNKIITVGNTNFPLDKIAFWKYYDDKGVKCVEVQVVSGRYFYFSGDMCDLFTREITQAYKAHYDAVIKNYYDDFVRSVNKKIAEGYALYGGMQVVESASGTKFFQVIVR